MTAPRKFQGEGMDLVGRKRAYPALESSLGNSRSSRRLGDCCWGWLVLKSAYLRASADRHVHSWARTHPESPRYLPHMPYPGPHIGCPYPG